MGILTLLTQSSANDSESEKIVRATRALRETRLAVSQLKCGSDPQVARIFSILVSIETSASRSEKLAALASCVAGAPKSCLNGAIDLLKGGNISVSSQVDLWTAVGDGAQLLASRQSASNHDDSDTPSTVLYPPIQHPRESKSRLGTTRWRSRRLGTFSSTTWNELASVADSFFTMLLVAPRQNNGLQFVAISRLQTFARIVTFLTATSHALVQWRLVVIEFALAFLADEAETRDAAWGLICAVCKTASDLSTREKITNSLAHVPWDAAPHVRKAQLRALTALSLD
jgi:hypothetical protein